MTSSLSDQDDDRRESQDSKLFEFTDFDIDLTRRPISEAVVRHLPSWLRAAVEARQHSGSKAPYTNALANCLLEQARTLLSLKQPADAKLKIAEATQLNQEAGNAVSLAECYRVTAEIHRGLGEQELALEYLKKEEEVRRRLAA